MKILQIANDYLNPLFKLMFDAISHTGIRNEVVVPIKYNGIERNNWKNEVVTLRCFSDLDNFFFHIKQRKIISSIENNIAISECDIIHAHTLFSNGYAAMKISKKHGKKYIVAVRNTDINTFFRFFLHLRVTGLKILMNAAAVVFLSPSYRDLVISKYVPKQLQKEILGKSYIIPNGISKVFIENIGKPKNKLEKDELILLYVGEITVNKNIARIIETARLRKNIGKKTRVLIIGELIDKACSSVLSDPIVEYHKKCTQNELINYYRFADIFIMPSHTETFGLVYVEAMSQGLPVLYTRGQGFDKQFDDGIVGYPVDDYNVEDINEKIDLILMNYGEISRNCIMNCERFDWNEIANKYLLLYTKILNKEI